MKMTKYEAVRQIPSIEALLETAKSDAAYAALSHSVLVGILRRATEQVRSEVLAGEGELAAAAGELAEQIFRRAAAHAAQVQTASLRRVINASGVVLHTNLGRAALGERSIQQVNAVMSGYSNLEYSLASGERSNRQIHVAGKIAAAVGAEDAIAVNNNAAAILLVLAGLARGREVIVSRGELVEIGGGFRIPEVMAESGAIMVEVGATNKTRLEDYERAITANTAAILKVHTSNFRIVGFSGGPADSELCGLARRQGLIAINDLGSGTLEPFDYAGHKEPSVRECIDAGFDVVTFSGDKLLGAGQAGIVAGRRQLLARLKQQPLLRAFRIDKLSLAALEGALIDYACGRPDETVPVWSMLKAAEPVLRERAEALAGALAQRLGGADWRIAVVKTRSLAGGGSLPAVELPGYGVEIKPAALSAAQLEAALRRLPLPVVALVRDDAVVLDVRCLRGDDGAAICRGLESIGRETQR